MTADWDIAPFSLVEIDRRFGDAYRIHHQGDEKAAHVKSGGDIISGRTRQKLDRTSREGGEDQVRKEREHGN
jgi:hypothetical protein